MQSTGLRTILDQQEWPGIGTATDIVGIIHRPNPLNEINQATR